MTQSAKFTSNATAIAHLLCLIFEDSKQRYANKSSNKKAGSEFANHLAFGPTLKEPQSDTGVHLVEHPGELRLRSVLRVTLMRCEQLVVAKRPGVERAARIAG
jgi:hypothetical protein